jgi:phytoene dehydrogenase-like protein
MTLRSKGVSRTEFDALVVGAGVSGLTTAICLAEAGLHVRIRDRRATAGDNLGLWSREPDTVTAAAIAARSAGVEPRIRDARVIGHRVGLHPTRPYVRVEEQRLNGTRLIHNYGARRCRRHALLGCARDVTSHLPRTG